MKISKQKINKIIKESIRSILFESRFESMSAEELLAVDFESLSPEEKNDYEMHLIHWLMILMMKKMIKAYKLQGVDL